MNCFTNVIRNICSENRVTHIEQNCNKHFLYLDANVKAAREQLHQNMILQPPQSYSPYICQIPSRLFFTAQFLNILFIMPRLLLKRCQVDCSVASITQKVQHFIQLLRKTLSCIVKPPVSTQLYNFPCLLPFILPLTCVNQFFDTLQRPDCIEWREL